ncbi:hypothetical protein FRC08_008472 [Ceratobasidium sp. 394]|nr:hypothetical protein FRC08_008472 [Ceratobasidium sp. 394]
MLPNTPCTISQRNESLLTMEDEGMGLNVIIVSPTGNPGEQEWTVEHQSENTITIRNVRHGKYIGVGEIEMNSRVVATSDPFQWTLEEESGRYCYRYEMGSSKVSRVNSMAAAEYMRRGRVRSCTLRCPC